MLMESSNCPVRFDENVKTNLVKSQDILPEWIGPHLEVESSHFKTRAIYENNQYHNEKSPENKNYFHKVKNLRHLLCKPSSKSKL